MLKRFVPGKWIDRAISEGDATFDAKLDEARKSAAKLTTKRGENGIMSSMKNRANSALALTLAIACAVAAPLRSDARSGSCGCGESRQLLAKQAFRGACPQIFLE